MVSPLACHDFALDLIHFGTLGLLTQMDMHHLLADL